MVKPLKLQTFRKLPTDDLVYEAIGARLDLDRTSIHRLAIRKLAYDMGILHPDFRECLVLLRHMTIALKGVQGADKLLGKAERYLAKHRKKLDPEPYPEEIEEEILDGCKAIRRRQARAIREGLASSRALLPDRHPEGG